MSEATEDSLKVFQLVYVRECVYGSVCMGVCLWECVCECIQERVYGNVQNSVKKRFQALVIPFHLNL